jgi:hypothetical protein
MSRGSSDFFAVIKHPDRYTDAQTAVITAVIITVGLWTYGYSLLHLMVVAPVLLMVCYAFWHIQKLADRKNSWWIQATLCSGIAICIGGFMGQSSYFPEAPISESGILIRLDMLCRLLGWCGILVVWLRRCA